MQMEKEQKGRTQEDTNQKVINSSHYEHMINHKKEKHEEKKKKKTSLDFPVVQMALSIVYK